MSVKVQPDSLYRLSGWIKTSDLKAATGRGALLNVHEVTSARTAAVTGTSDWTKVSCEFLTGPRTEAMVNCLYGGWGQATGKACSLSRTLGIISITVATMAINEQAHIKKVSSL